MLGALDRALLRLLRTRGHGARAERAVARFSRLGEHGLLWVGVAGMGALLDEARRPVYLRGARAVVCAYLSNQAIKAVVRRRRPVLDGLPAVAPTVSSLSYPSAHAATSFAAARALSTALPRPALYGVAAAMALSRPYLGLHYPSDMLAGAALGSAVAELVP